MTVSGICTKCNTAFTLSENQPSCGGVTTSFMCGCHDQSLQSNLDPDIESKIKILDKNISKLKKQAFEARSRSEEAMNALVAEFEKESKVNSLDSSLEKRIFNLEADVALIKSLLSQGQNKIIKG